MRLVSLVSLVVVGLPGALREVMSVHVACRGGVYPRSAVPRLPVPEELVPWSAAWVYSPPEHSSHTLAGKPWADPPLDDPNFKPNWNVLDGKVNRVSYTGDYTIDNGRPLNPRGRTGLKGRGVLGRWGPNHAADPIVTRWKVESGAPVIHQDTQRPILQFVGVKRRDNGQWALPGGMVDPGEHIAATAVREFKEEATNSLEMTDDKRADWSKKFDAFFARGEIVYQGYVDDPRNTDNAWMETSAYSFHDGDGSVVGSLPLHAGDDAVGVRWMDVGRHLELYASHGLIVEAVAKLREAHW